MSSRILLWIKTIILATIAPIGINADAVVDSCLIDSGIITNSTSEYRFDSKTKDGPLSPYGMTYSLTGNSYDWHRLWINTATLSGAFVGTLLVLECLPEDATSWNRAELQDVPLFKRWHKHVIEKGPEWDHDKFYFNYILHPYAGATYFMGARSCGFNFWKLPLLISNFLYLFPFSEIGYIIYVFCKFSDLFQGKTSAGFAFFSVFSENIF